jgi:carboxypeptidase C (cathepsin A)
MYLPRDTFIRGEQNMDKVVPVQPELSDQPLLDTTQYGPGPNDSINDATENVVATQKSITINGVTISYTTHAGHLVAYDQDTARPYAKIFYISFAKNDVAASSRPVTFFYNGGPGSSSVYLLLGSFGPRRIRTSMPEFTPPAPYTLEDNGDSLLDRTDLVFINPVGTGYSAAIAPATNQDFWGVDKDAQSIKQFIKRYLTRYGRWNSPKFLFGESYGTPRTCVLTWLLHEDGVDLNGIILQSSILDWSQRFNPVGLLPTFAADALYHDKVTLSPPPPRTDVDGFMKQVEDFARGKFAAAKATYTKGDPATVEFLSQIIGIPPEVLEDWNLDPAIGYNTIFLKSLFKDKVLGQYDGRVTSNDTGIAGSVSSNSGGNDPTITAVGGIYTAMWNVYLNEELKYTSTSPFIALNFRVAEMWKFEHTDPTGAEKGGPETLYTAGDLAASMEINPYLKVFCANGYYDAVTPFFQTKLDLENMPIGDPKGLKNLVFHNYESGHMIYLDNLSNSRSKMKEHLGAFYDGIPAHVAAVTAELASRTERPISPSRFRRRFSRTPY